MTLSHVPLRAITGAFISAGLLARRRTDPTLERTGRYFGGIRMPPSTRSV
jgi:hypothetical protein